MACKTSFEVHHNFPKLAEESGFTFNTHRPRVHINWNKIKLIDIDNVVRDRKFSLVEEHINDILDCVLESEFDVRILDDGVLKLFRLAQLAVEYQQFCRHYLDRSVFILREEITNLLQNLDATKKSLREKEEENRKFKRKSKHSIRTPLPYGNENIAAMLLKTLNQTKGDLFASTSQIDSMQYNKCNYCEKVFLNQLYLKSHISRRHANVLEIPQRDTPDEEVNNIRNDKLASEVDDLKNKLKQMEELIANKYNSNTQDVLQETSHLDSCTKNEGNTASNCKKEMKDAEVSTNEDGYILDKIQEWKKEEHEKYNEELNSLRKQIIDIISAKEKQDNTSTQQDLKMMEQLHATIKQQGSEILALKQELIKEEGIEKEKRKKIEEQMEFWVKRAEMQSTEYKTLLQKLNDVATEAQEFRLQATTEKERANKLEQLLQNHLSKTSPKHTGAENKQKVPLIGHNKENYSRREVKNTKEAQTTPTANEITLRKLQQKAQELLNIEQTTTSESSSVSDDKVNKGHSQKESDCDDMVKNKIKNGKVDHEDIIKLKPRTSFRTSDKIGSADTKYTEKKQSSNRKSKPTVNKTCKKGNGYVYVPGSPIKIVRAKITEEVNQRLISLGVDPLGSTLSRHVFQKQRKQLQEQQDYKSKKWPARNKVLNSIICHLDQHTSNTNSIQQNDYLSSNNPRKTFSIASVLSNVKTKALSLVKSNEPSYKPYKPYDDVAKKAMALLKTPPGSTHSSPIKHRTSVNSSQEHDVLKTKNKYHSPKIKSKKPIERESSNESYSENDDRNKHKNSTINVKTVTSPVHHSADRRNSNNQNGSKLEAINVNTKTFLENNDNSSDDKESIDDISPRKFLSEENLSNLKQTKGVLKNASSTSSLNKKKVLFDMDAIQMKSLSASPSQSITDKCDNKKNNDPVIVNLDTEEWDISSIDNEPIENKLNKISSRTSPKIAELKNTIESKLTRRNPTLSTTLVGGVDVLAASKQKATMQSHGGSNTSLGSSILDDTESGPVLDLTAFKPRTAFGKDDSEIEISDFTDDKIVQKTF